MKFSNQKSLLILINNIIYSFHKYCCSFNFISLEHTLQEINNLHPTKETQATDVSTCINKTNKKLAVFSIYHYINKALSRFFFPI